MFAVAGHLLVPIAPPGGVDMAHAVMRRGGQTPEEEFEAVMGQSAEDVSYKNMLKYAQRINVSKRRSACPQLPRGTTRECGKYSARQLMSHGLAG